MAHEVPSELRYTKDHEWVRVEGDLARVGITDFAQDQLTDVVYAKIPRKGDRVKAHDVIGEVESIKSVSEIFSPVSGEIVDVNEALNAEPGLLNRSPYKDGWFCVIRLANPGELAGLLTDKDYRAHTQAGGH
ncbi:MAG TPA: glycine cleavage system protein GcvH [Candidatus Thermoplasmatota archaeon]|nr:glycine cleavage system protein GcvH [Candidatus Thermoplasmatota archaeon]